MPTVRKSEVLDDGGPYWTAPLPIDRKDLAPSIRREIDRQAERKSFKSYVVQIYEEPAGKPTGMFEIAFNPKSHMACAIYEAETEAERSSQRVVMETDPLWFSASDPEDATDVFFQTLGACAGET